MVTAWREALLGRCVTEAWTEVKPQANMLNTNRCYDYDQVQQKFVAVYLPHTHT